MQLHEVIEQESIAKVGSQTNISIDILENIVSEKFEKLTRVKVLGFLLILEREYKDIDVQGIRDRAKLYFEEHKPVDEKVVVLSTDSGSRDGFSFFKWFIILGLVGGAWYLYSNGKLNMLLKDVKEKEDFFDDKKALDNNVTAEEAKQIVITNSEIQSLKIDTLDAPVIKESIPLSNDERVIKLSKEKSSQPEIESLKNTIESVEKAETIVEESKPIEETKSPIKVQKVLQVAVLNQAEKSVSKNNMSSEIIKHTITVNPTRGMLWFGFINIDTKVKKEFMKKVSTPFELKSGRWLLVTGHGFVDIVSDSQTIEVADSQKHYFYIDSNEIKELNNQEFKKMNGNRGW